MPKVAVVSLGCAKNLVDTEIMLGQLMDGGYELTQNFAEAELILVNTCGFIQTAKEESIHHILEMAGYKDPKQGRCSKLVVAGCLVQRYAAELALEIPEVDHWIKLAEIGSVIDLMKESDRKHPKNNDLPFLNNQNLRRYQVTLPHTTYVKIAEGCNHCCSYCAIPLIKGRFRSRHMEAIVNETVALVNSGVQEINLIAQDITMYGRDMPGSTSLKDLLAQIIREANPHWIRLLYAYPTGIDNELLEFIAAQPTICKYLDIPLQHINSRILRMMNRPDSPEQIVKLLNRIKSAIPGIVLRSTFIVGFPSESDGEFQELMDFISEGYFQHVGVFTYSVEEGTAAFGYKPKVKEAVKQARRNRLLDAQRPISARFLKSLTGRQCEILIDKVLLDGTMVGRTPFLAPEVDGVVYCKNFSGNPGEFKQSKILQSDEYNLWAEPWPGNE
jgi:ribosomal protein S12 methylthiotransferase